MLPLNFYYTLSNVPYCSLHQLTYSLLQGGTAFFTYLQNTPVDTSTLERLPFDTLLFACTSVETGTLIESLFRFPFSDIQRLQIILKKIQHETEDPVPVLRAFVRTYLPSPHLPVVFADASREEFFQFIEDENLSPELKLNVFFNQCLIRLFEKRLLFPAHKDLIENRLLNENISLELSWKIFEKLYEKSEISVQKGELCRAWISSYPFPEAPTHNLGFLTFLCIAFVDFDMPEEQRQVIYQHLRTMRFASREQAQNFFVHLSEIWGENLDGLWSSPLLPYEGHWYTIDDWRNWMEDPQTLDDLVPLMPSCLISLIAFVYPTLLSQRLTPTQMKGVALGIYRLEDLSIADCTEEQLAKIFPSIPEETLQHLAGKEAALFEHETILAYVRFEAMQRQSLLDEKIIALSTLLENFQRLYTPLRKAYDRAFPSLDFPVKVESDRWKFLKEKIEE